MTRRKMLLMTAGTTVGLTVASSGFVWADDQPIETQVVDAMNKAFGAHPGFRANHAKGLVVEGTFKASSQAAVLSKAALFNGNTIPVTVRFSDTTEIPNVPDGSRRANPHGMAIKFHLPDGSDTDMVLNSLKFFPVSNAADFRDLLLAVAASPPDAANRRNSSSSWPATPRCQPRLPPRLRRIVSPMKSTMALMHSFS